MAVPGRKASDSRESVLKGSAEDLEHNCEPCLSIGQQKEAERFCVECQQSLCKSCIAYHQRIKSTKNHKLLDKDEMLRLTVPSKDTTMCTETCPIHKNEIIKFFCTDHEFLGCNDCITLDHRTCTIDYIPDKCADIGDSREYKDTLKEVDRKIKDMEAIIDKAKELDRKIDISHDHLTEDIVKFRKEINDHLDLLQKKLETKAAEQKSEHKDIIAKLLKTCTSVSKAMLKFKYNLQDSKTSKENGQSYILIKQAQSKLKTDDFIATKEFLEKADVKFTFEKNKELENYLAEQDKFGTLILSPIHFPRKKKYFDKLTPKENIDLGTKSDKNECCITGCAVLSSNKIVLADSHNSKLKMVDTEMQMVTGEKKLDSQPWDIAVLPEDEIAVTVPDKKKILILTTGDKLSIIRKISIKKGECRGITYHEDQLYVVCLDPTKVLLTDTQGNVRNTILLEDDIFLPYYILLSKDFGHIYVSDECSNSVVSVSLQGDVSAVYKHKHLEQPVGMAMLDDGSLLVCCYGNNTIHHISRDLKQGRIIQEGLNDTPRSICYNQHQQEFNIGGECDKLMIMN